MKNYLKLFGLPAIVAAAAIFSGTTQASLIGDTVGCDIQPGSLWSCDNATAVVTDPGAEFILSLVSDDFFSVDLDADSITLNYISVGGLGTRAGEELTLSDLDWVGMEGMIVGIDNFTSTVGGITVDDIDFTADSVSIDMNNGNYSQGDSFSFDLVTTHVPEPASLALLSIGLAGIGLARRRKV